MPPHVVVVEALGAKLAGPGAQVILGPGAAGPLGRWLTAQRLVQRLAAADAEDLRTDKTCFAGTCGPKGYDARSGGPCGGRYVPLSRGFVPPNPRRRGEPDGILRVSGACTDEPGERAGSARAMTAQPGSGIPASGEQQPRSTAK
jgi:hypothetical protein